MTPTHLHNTHNQRLCKQSSMEKTSTCTTHLVFKQVFESISTGRILQYDCTVIACDLLLIDMLLARVPKVRKYYCTFTFVDGSMCIMQVVSRVWLC